MPDYDNKWWTPPDDPDQWADNLEETRRWIAEETDEPIKRKRKKRIVKKKVKPHSPNNHFRRIQLMVECQCKRPRICKKTTCHHYGIHEFNKDKCKKKKCTFDKLETVQMVGIFKGKEVRGRPFKHTATINRNVICEIKEEK